MLATKCVTGSGRDVSGGGLRRTFHPSIQPVIFVSTLNRFPSFFYLRGINLLAASIDIHDVPPLTLAIRTRAIFFSGC